MPISPLVILSKILENLLLKRLKPVISFDIVKFGEQHPIMKQIHRIVNEIVLKKTGYVYLPL